MMGADRGILDTLRNSLNETMKFKYGLTAAFPEARRWGMV